MSTVVNRRLLSCSLMTLLVAAMGCQDAGAPVSVTTNKPVETATPPETAATPVTPETTSTPPETTATNGDPAALPAELATNDTVPNTPVVPTTPETPEEQPAAETLGIGDPAPALAISKWLTGEPVALLEPNQVYVVEFWATWCPPCRSSMPHISQLQTEYGDQVQFIGVTRETEDVVQEFLGEEQSEGKLWKDVITYRLALDQDDAMNAAYMQAANQNGIPTAFIVGRDGAVEWIGHPMEIEEPLAKVVAGDWDRAAAIAEFEQQEKLQQIQMELSREVRDQNWDKALELLDQAQAAMGPAPGLTQYRIAVLQMAGRTDEVAPLQAELVKQSWDDAMALNDIAWGIALTEGDRDLDLAQKTAERAAELSNNEDASILDTLARVYYEQGKLKEAVEWQKKAVEQEPGNEQLAETLKMYETELAAPADSDKPAAEESSTPEEGTTPPQTEGTEESKDTP